MEQSEHCDGRSGGWAGWEWGCGMGHLSSLQPGPLGAGGREGGVSTQAGFVGLSSCLSSGPSRCGRLSQALLRDCFPPPVKLWLDKSLEKGVAS